MKIQTTNGFGLQVQLLQECLLAIKLQQVGYSNIYSLKVLKFKTNKQIKIYQNKIIQKRYQTKIQKLRSEDIIPINSLTLTLSIQNGPFHKKLSQIYHKH